jgi:hypothetical protein
MIYAHIITATPPHPTKPPPFAVGDRVTSTLYPDESHVVRRIIAIAPSLYLASGYSVTADGGECCGSCRRPFGRVLPCVDSAFFKLAKDN